jgi:hypothetical protein
MSKLIVTGSGIILTLAGCGGGLGGPVTVTPDRYQSIQPQGQAAVALQLPAADGFAIHDKSSQQSPGQGGTASSTADARPDGTAFCAASASNGGAASSTFVLGAALHNESNTVLPVAVTCDIEYAYGLETTVPADGHKTTGTIAFLLEAREQETGKLLFQHPLASLSGYEDNVKRSDQQRVQFVARVSPMARWRIVLQGQAEAQTSQDGKADVEVRVARCQMTVKPLAAAAAPASAPASQPQPAR